MIFCFPKQRCSCLHASSCCGHAVIGSKITAHSLNLFKRDSPVSPVRFGALVEGLVPLDHALPSQFAAVRLGHPGKQGSEPPHHCPDVTS